MPRFPGQPSPSAEPRFRLVLVFPDSSEIRHLDSVPEPGTRLRSASGHESFVVEVLQSGRVTYTVRCLGRREYLDEFGTASVRGRVVAGDLLEDIGRGSAHTRERATELVDGVSDELLRRVRRSIRDQGWRRTKTTFVASFVSADGRLFEDVILAKSVSSAESDALERARYWNMTLKDVQPGSEWLNSSYGPASGRRRRRIARLLPRVR